MKCRNVGEGSICIIPNFVAFVELVWGGREGNNNKLQRRRGRCLYVHSQRLLTVKGLMNTCLIDIFVDCARMLKSQPTRPTKWRSPLSFTVAWDSFADFAATSINLWSKERFDFLMILLRSYFIVTTWCQLKQKILISISRWIVVGDFGNFGELVTCQ